ncbi:hypothetical protein CDAR_416981 [Caerostris darwini]|uniref:Uncharacterized protein n=1 Tax=Caerostris darwini TaxID=1538125 RepID=A0AAV4X8N2_9ARAC|nr:hypothetical protein CDAR_416981 [Caerostris darwini]
MDGRGRRIISIGLKPNSRTNTQMTAPEWTRLAGRWSSSCGGTSTYECPNIRVFRDTSRRASDFLLLVTSEIRDTSPVRFGSLVTRSRAITIS